MYFSKLSDGLGVRRKIQGDLKTYNKEDHLASPFFRIELSGSFLGVVGAGKITPRKSPLSCILKNGEELVGKGGVGRWV